MLFKLISELNLLDSLNQSVCVCRNISMIFSAMPVFQEENKKEREVKIQVDIRL